MIFEVSSSETHSLQFKLPATASAEWFRANDAKIQYPQIKVFNAEPHSLQFKLPAIASAEWFRANDAKIQYPQIEV